MKHVLAGNIRLWIRQALIIAITTVVLYVVIDTAFGVFYKPKPYASHIERLHSPSYIDEPYFSEQFLAESFSQPGGWLTPEGTRLVLPQEFHGDFFNVDILKPTGLTYRRTINPSADGESATTILLLGGSTIYNSEVPDEYTVASQLSAILSKWQGHRYVTINAGVTSASSVQEIERLKMELKAGLRPDIVISYGGVNDVLQGVYFGNPDGVMFDNSKRAPAVVESGLKSRLKALMPESLLEAYRKVRATVSGKHIYQAIMAQRRNEGARETPGHLKDEQRIQDLVKRTKGKYFENMLEGHNLARSSGFQFISVVQPHMYSTQYANNYADIRLAEELEARRLPMADVAFRRAHPGLQKAVKELRDQGVAAHDCSAILLSRTSNIFLDSHHVNAAGNKIIACALASLVVERSESPISDPNGQLQECEKVLGSLPVCGQHGS
jgi:lysophospholipase L1-like esterase